MLPKRSCCLTPSECELFYFPDYFAGVTLLDQILCLGIIREAEGSPWGPPEVTGLPGFLIRVPPDFSGKKGGGSSKICGHLAGGGCLCPSPQSRSMSPCSVGDPSPSRATRKLPWLWKHAPGDRERSPPQLSVTHLHLG